MTADSLSKIRYLEEDEYLEYMHGENRIWRENHLIAGDLPSFDGLSLRYYHAAQPESDKARGCIVILHGFCGFSGKFHETMEYFWKAGYDVFFLEQRGHGYSERETDDKDLVHVRDYSDYTRDVKTFMDKVVIPNTTGLKRTLFGHSMGGAIATLFLEEFPEYFDSALLCSPMLELKLDMPKFLIHLLQAKVKLLHQENEPLQGGKRFNGVMDFPNSNMMSEPRLKYLFDQRIEDKHYQTNMASNGWATASFRAMAKIQKNAEKVRIPVLLLSAGNDALVTEAGQEAFAAKAKNTKIVKFPDAKHELFGGTVEIRKKFYSEIFDFLDEQNS